MISLSKIIKRKLNQHLLTQYYHLIKQITTETVRGENEVDREITIILLECGHGFWQEQTKPIDNHKPVLCESCFLSRLIARNGHKEGMRKFKLWERWLRV